MSYEYIRVFNQDLDASFRSLNFTGTADRQGGDKEIARSLHKSYPTEARKDLSEIWASFRLKPPASGQVVCQPPGIVPCASQRAAWKWNMTIQYSNKIDWGCPSKPMNILTNILHKMDYSFPGAEGHCNKAQPEECLKNEGILETSNVFKYQMLFLALFTVADVTFLLALLRNALSKVGVTTWLGWIRKHHGHAGSQTTQQPFVLGFRVLERLVLCHIDLSFFHNFSRH